MGDSSAGVEGRLAQLTDTQHTTPTHTAQAYAQLWRENTTKERALKLLALDPHGPNEWRTNGPLSNLSQFHEAFGIGADDALYRAPDTRVMIW